MTKLKKISAIFATAVMTMIIAAGVCQATNFSDVVVSGTGSKTLMNKKVSIQTMTLKVTSCKFTDYFITKGKINYELWSAGYSETKKRNDWNFLFCTSEFSFKNLFS